MRRSSLKLCGARREFGDPTDEDGATAIARRSQGTPRIANRLLRRVRDYTEVKANGRVDGATAEAALDLLSVDAQVSTILIGACFSP